MQKEHFVYIILTEKNTLYCGYTDNIERRFNEHLSGKGAKYTKAFKPLKVVYQKRFASKSEALKEEYRIKNKMTKAEKWGLIYSSSSSVYSSGS